MRIRQPTHYLLGRGLTILLLSSSSCGNSSNNNNKGTNFAFFDFESRLSELSPRRHHCQRSNCNYHADDDVIGNTFRLFNDYGSHYPNRRRRRYIPQHGKYQDRMEMSRKNAISIISPRGGGAAAAYEPVLFLNDDDVDDDLIVRSGDKQTQKRSRSTGEVGASFIEPANEKDSDGEGEGEIMTSNNISY